MLSSEILPAILVHSAEEAKRAFTLLTGATSSIHLDVMDGHFAPQTTWYDAETIRAWDLPFQIELHLMVRDPARVIEAWRDVPAFRRAIWHVEIPIDHATLLRTVRTQHEAGLALSPTTPITQLAPHLLNLDEVLFMGVNIGYSGQAFISSVQEKITRFHAQYPHIIIGCDGGIQADNLLALRAAGVQRFCMANSIFHASDPIAQLATLQQILA